MLRDNPVSTGATKHSSTINPLSQESIDYSFSPPVALPDVIYPLERVLLHTLDYIEIPPNHVGFVQLRSTFARMGLIIPPTYADPGFYGTLTMEVFNTNKRPIQLYPGLAMWSIVICPCLDEPLYTQENGARYMDQGQHVVLPIALKHKSDGHMSDCAVHSEPAYPNGPCNCKNGYPHIRSCALNNDT